MEQISKILLEHAKQKKSTNTDQKKRKLGHVYSDADIDAINSARNTRDDIVYYKGRSALQAAGSVPNAISGILMKDNRFLRDGSNNMIIELPACASRQGSPIDLYLTPQMEFLQQAIYAKPPIGASYPVKILFPYKLHAWHWNVGEIIIDDSIIDDSLKVTACKYDSYGTISAIEPDMQGDIKKCLQKMMKFVVFDFAFKTTPINKVQTGVACGLYAAIAMHNLKTKPVDNIWDGISNDSGGRFCEQELRDSDQYLFNQYGPNNAQGVRAEDVVDTEANLFAEDEQLKAATEASLGNIDNDLQAAIEASLTNIDNDLQAAIEASLGNLKAAPEAGDIDDELQAAIAESLKEMSVEDRRSLFENILNEYFQIISKIDKDQKKQKEAKQKLINDLLDLGVDNTQKFINDILEADNDQVDVDTVVPEYLIFKDKNTTNEKTPTASPTTPTAKLFGEVFRKYNDRAEVSLTTLKYPQQDVDKSQFALKESVKRASDVIQNAFKEYNKHCKTYAQFNGQDLTELTAEEVNEFVVMMKEFNESRKEALITGDDSKVGFTSWKSFVNNISYTTKEELGLKLEKFQEFSAEIQIQATSLCFGSPNGLERIDKVGKLGAQNTKYGARSFEIVQLLPDDYKFQNIEKLK